MSNQVHDLILLQNDNLQVEISPTVGASIYSFKYNLDGNWVEIMRPTPVTALQENLPGQFSSFNMIPYSNRIENGVLLHRAQSYQLAINNNDGHAIHGEARNRPWQVKSHTDQTLELEFNSLDFTDISWPFPFKSKVEFMLDGSSFKLDMAITNLSDQDMPAGMGIHPYFVRQLTDKDNKVLVNFPTVGIYPGDTPIPTGTWEQPTPKYEFSTTRELTADFIDNCFRVKHEPAKIQWVNSGVELTMDWDEVYKHLIIYCPKDDSSVFAVEPVTNCNNGFNLANQGVPDTGTVYLEPQEKLQGSIAITLGRL